ncbi:O-antigen ligase family protein [Pseudobacter ginsenosidimutans]|uniref:O-antigen ligase n=1 Tax=Pseudobacter ginsenosidimutans TaxID=661488 RepID=A0A4Q7MV38_9BACT|nr:O-antigen ligase family protein [Pseudobacter ginsenosidimutans]QEC42195.1 O-antigen ligase family protein [Pseudobacter ginsenosidimutans]RZS70963.1 O-antigen ligase [Pseudobacter ginsenosidimutans]
MRSIFLTDPEGLQIPVKEKGLYALFAGFMISFFLPGMPVVNNILFGLLFVYSFLFNTHGEKGWLLRRRLAVAGMIVFFLLQVLSVLYSSNKKEGLEMVVLRLPMLMFPIAIGTIRIGDLLKKRLMALWVMVMLLAAVVTFICSMVVVIRTGESSWFYNDSLTVAIGWQSSYFAILLTVTLYMFVYLIESGAWPFSRAISFVIGAFFLVFHFLLASRMNIILLYSSIFLYALYGMVLKRKYKLGLYIMSGLVLGALMLVLLFPKTINRFRELGYRQFDYSSRGVESHYDMEVKPDQWNGANIRLAVWQCGWELVQKHPVLGTGIGDKMDELMEAYKMNGFVMGVETRRNLHNTYLDVLVATGFTGLILFLLAWIILPLLYCLKSRDWLGACIIVALAFGCITETYIDRSQGNYMLGFLITFIVSCRRQDQ